jgi:hypothetical protein
MSCAGSGAALGAVDAVVLAVDVDAAALGRVPNLPNHVDRLAQCGDRSALGAVGAAHRLDRLPEGAGAEAELEAAAGEEIEAGRRAREHCRLAQRQVEHAAASAVIAEDLRMQQTGPDPVSEAFGRGSRAGSCPNARLDPVSLRAASLLLLP